MTILLDTGSLLHPHSPQITTGKVTVDNTPSERVVYPNNKEQLIVVKPGEMVVVTSYGIVDTKVEVKKVLLSSGVPELGTGGCNPVITSAQSTVLNRATVSCYTMCKEHPLAVLDIPGVYSVAPLVDENGEIFITAVGHPLQSSGPRCPCNGPDLDFGV